MSACPCPQKVAYPSQGQALRAAVHLSRLGPQRAYRCACGAFHLTSHRAITVPKRLQPNG